MLPVFETKRLILRGVTEADALSYQKYFADYEVIRHLTRLVPWPYPEGGALSYIRNVILPVQGKDRWVWGIFLKENPEELVDAVDLWREGKPEHRGFWLGRKFWGQGIMTEAVHPVMDYAFDHLGFEKLVFANARDNRRSGRIKEKTGARPIGIRPGKYVDPAYTEQEVWELKKEDWKKFISI
jgi:RimJ/RimL family protein N-acetyltransferase